MAASARGVLAGFAVASATLFVMAVVAVLNLSAVREEASWVDHSFQVRETIDDAATALAELEARWAESSEASVAPGREATAVLRRLRELLQRATALTVDNAAQQDRLLQLGALFGDLQILPAAPGSVEASHVARFAAMQGLLGELRREEGRLLTVRRTVLSGRALTLLVVIAGGCSLLAVFLLVTLASVLRADAQRKALIDDQVQLMGIVGHDLRSPLSAIMSSGSFLSMSREITAERRIAVGQRVLTSARRMERIIRDLIDFTRQQIGAEISIQFAETDMARVAEKVVEELRLEFPDRLLVFESVGEVQGDFDGDRLAQVLSNLLVNALCYGDATTAVSLRLTGGVPHVRIEVHNRGVPIAPELVPLIFEPFRRGESIPANPNRSLGLGLYIVRRLVDAHEGAVEVQSSVEAGTTFRITLPRARRAAAPPAQR